MGLYDEIFTLYVLIMSKCVGIEYKRDKKQKDTEKTTRHKTNTIEENLGRIQSRYNIKTRQNTKLSRIQRK